MAISENLFGRSRQRLTMLYSLVMIVFLATSELEYSRKIQMAITFSLK